MDLLSVVDNPLFTFEPTNVNFEDGCCFHWWVLNASAFFWTLQMFSGLYSLPRYNLSVYILVIVREVPNLEKIELFTPHAIYCLCDVCLSGAANESTRNRVIFYTIGEYMLLILASGLQVVYIRRLFSKSVGYNRVWQIQEPATVFFFGT